MPSYRATDPMGANLENERENMAKFWAPFTRRRKLVAQLRAEGKLPEAPHVTREFYPPGTRRMPLSGDDRWGGRPNAK